MKAAEPFEPSRKVACSSCLPGGAQAEAVADRGDYLEWVPVPIAKEERLTLDQRRAYFGELDADGRASVELDLPPVPRGPAAGGR